MIWEAMEYYSSSLARRTGMRRIWIGIPYRSKLKMIRSTHTKESVYLGSSKEEKVPLSSNRQRWSSGMFVRNPIHTFYPTRP
jgi:hypothetical protein